MTTDAMVPQHPTEALVAPHEIEYTYTRSTGPVIGAFLGGLREKRIIGARGSDGRVLVPPSDYDPVTSEDLTELVEVGTSGVVTTWSWNDTPLEGQPLDKPFAWALVTLDGADTGLLAALDAGSADKVSTGMRVTAKFADTPTGTVKDLVCFVPEGA
ncbi:MAG TPA: OB-fold domain-containing protein [Mycobacteriales bacterium]|nr:OB-fold domain-containing protein [Mycobacteriales bacterium]